MVFVAAAQRIVVGGAIDGAGGAAGTSRRYLIGVGAHRGGHLSARHRQDAIAQCNVLQLFVNVNIAGQRLSGADGARHQLHIVVDRAIALIDFGLARILTTG